MLAGESRGACAGGAQWRMCEAQVGLVPGGRAGKGRECHFACTRFMHLRLFREGSP